MVRWDGVNMECPFVCVKFVPHGAQIDLPLFG